MKTKNISKILTISLAFILALGVIFFQPSLEVSAQLFIGETIEDENFSLNISANARKSTTLPLDERTAQDSTGREVTYFCFKWRELESFTFRITPKEEADFLSYKLSVTYAKSETLDASIGTGETQTLYQGESPLQFDFFYYIDSTADDKTSIYSRSGHDFGLYKFEFIYDHTVENEQVELSIGQFYVAVLPDSLDEVQFPTASPLVYSVSSASKLLSRYNFTLSTSAFDYVNPARLQWEVVGTDIENLNYCLDKTMQENNQIEYGGYNLIYPSSLPTELTTGKSFVFDSNNIEGIWTVTLTFLDNEGQTVETYKIEDLSTIKVEQKSNLWLILTIVFSALAFIAVVVAVSIIILKKHHDKVQ